MEILNVIEKALIALTGKEGIKPCDYFDMIAGTSTGGYVANQIVISSGDDKRMLAHRIQKDTEGGIKAENICERKPESIGFCLLSS